MDFFKYKCPVCEQQFKQGDDIVVCPECGTPHHRECYTEHGSCFYQDKHSDTFSFDETLENNSENNSSENATENNTDTVICPACKCENHKTMFYCNQCGFPLNAQNKNNQNNNDNTNGNEQSYTPFGTPFDVNAQQFNMVFDPMAGLKNDDIIGENTTAGECAKFVGKNTPYFLRVFNNIKRFGTSKFNFSSFLFSGTYFLYRKMYLIGAIITAIVFALTITSTFISLTPEYAEIYSIIQENSKNYSLTAMSINNFDVNSPIFEGLTSVDVMYYYLPPLLELLRYAVMFVCGFISNRLYYKHCIKKINKIKKSVDSSKLNKALEKSGGVNLAIAVCIEITFIVITEMPAILHFFQII